MLLEAMKGKHCHIDKLYLRSTQLTEKAMNWHWLQEISLSRRLVSQVVKRLETHH